MVCFRVSTALCSGCVRVTGGGGSACAALSRDGSGPPPCVSARPFPVAQARSARGCGARPHEAPRRVHAWCGWGSGRRRLCDSRKPPSPRPQRVRRGTRGGSGRRRRRRGGAAAGGGGDVTKVGMRQREMVRFCVSTALCRGRVRATGGEGSVCAALSRDGPGPPPCVSARPLSVAQVRSARGCRERPREAPRRVHARCGWGSDRP